VTISCEKGNKTLGYINCENLFDWASGSLGVLWNCAVFYFNWLAGWFVGWYVCYNVTNCRHLPREVITFSQRKLISWMILSFFVFVCLFVCYSVKRFIKYSHSFVYCLIAHGCPNSS